MRAVFRVDSGIDIGTGHVMRCLTLADALSENGVQCTFLCRLGEGHLLDVITERGYQVLSLSTRDKAHSPDYSGAGDPPHASWLGTDWASDAEDTMRSLRRHDFGGKTDWIIVDHYALDRRWHAAVRDSAQHLMVIDDLADRPHDCDILLDQTLGRSPADYIDLTPTGTKLLLGPQFALLRPEFARWRPASLARRESPTLKNILVAMGGVDKDNATESVLDVLDRQRFSEEVSITVVLGAKAPWYDRVRERAGSLNRSTVVLKNVRNIAEIMAKSDLAIGAGGTTTWERCSVGIPTIQLSLASNQDLITEAVSEANAVSVTTLETLPQALDHLLEPTTMPQKLAAMSREAANVADGSGAERVVNALMEFGN